MILNRKTDYIFAGSGDSSVLEPGFAIIEQLRSLDPGVQTGLVGNGGMLEYEAAKRLAVPYWTAAATRRTSSVLPDFFGTTVERRLLERERPSVVISLGGEVGMSVGRAAAALGIPCIMLEQNTEPSSHTRRFSKYADMLCLAFEGAKANFRPTCPTRTTGTPVSRGFHLAGKRRQSADSRGRFRRLIILEDSHSHPSDNADVPRVVARMRQQLRKWRIVHQTKSDGIPHLKNWYYRCGADVVTTAHIHRLPQQLAKADLVITPGNSNRLFELSAVGVPSIVLPPSGAAGISQQRNGEEFESAGACEVVSADDRLESLTDILDSLLEDEQRLQAMSDAAYQRSHPSAAAEVASLVCGASQSGRNIRQQKESAGTGRSIFAALSR